MVTRCPACFSCVLSPYYLPGPQPLVALSLPESFEEAKATPRYPFSFHTCKRCGHVFNAAFNPNDVIYSASSNLMYNTGRGWQVHLDRVVERLCSRTVLSGSTVLDIGAGDGLFLRLLRDRLRPSNGRFVAFEPSPEANICCEGGLETFRSYFYPPRDLKLIMPDILVCRHVIEHLAHPRDFVEEIALYSDRSRPPFFLVEVPCITKAVQLRRVEDYLYEHPQNFTPNSLRLMMELAGWFTYSCDLEYNDEVVVWCGVLAGSHAAASGQLRVAQEGVALQTLSATAEVAYWGGTGKGAAFLNAYGVAGGRVIDSDVRKAGRYVPGTGQKIETPSTLQTRPVDTVVVTTRWRAADIYQEIKTNHPCVQKVFVMDQGCLCEYTEAMYVKEK